MKIMNRIRGFESALPALLAAVLVLVGLAPAGSTEAYSQRRSSRTQTRKPVTPPSIYEQGYKKGYDDGFEQGSLDWRRAAPRDFERSDAYQKREDLYDPNQASSDLYRRGFALGLEIGYTDGYFGRAKSADVPANGERLARALALAEARQTQPREPEYRPDTRPRTTTQPRDDRSTARDDRSGRGTAPDRAEPVSLNIPRDTQMQVRLTSSIDTKNNRVGDKFTAVVISPSPYSGATVEGHIATLNKSGKVTGRTELGLAFDQIILEDGRSAPIEAELKQIVESETVKKVDEEGKVESGSRSKDSQVRGGVGAVGGAILGGILGGGKGALLGAIIGGAAGVGTVYIEGSKDLILEPGTDMIINVVRSSPR